MTAILLANMSGSLMLFLAAVIAMGLVMRRMARRSRSSSADPCLGFTRNSRGKLERSLELPAATNRSQVEMYELARDMQGELDSKMRILQILVDQARREADRLEELLAEAGQRKRSHRDEAVRLRS
jgi:hypothetical protein